jgi:hypothetical protein
MVDNGDMVEILTFNGEHYDVTIKHLAITGILTTHDNVIPWDDIKKIEVI